MKVLIAEDDRDLNEIIVKKLRAEGYEVDACFDGKEALLYLETYDYDALVLDYMMPILNGIETIKRMRSKGDSTPVIFLTARDTIEDKIEGLDAGANDYLVKPFSFAEQLPEFEQ